MSEPRLDAATNKPAVFLALRHYFVLIVLLGLLAGLVGRAFYLQIVEKEFLASQGVQRQNRTIETPAYRGAILDRSGTPLAISTPVDSVWVNPPEILENLDALKRVTRQLGLDYRQTVTNLKEKAKREFVYLKRQVEPELAAKVANDIEGIYLQREYQRYYPAGEVVSHLVGFTDIDDRGQEGLELMYENWLKAQPGERQVARNRKGAVIEDIAQVKPALSGNDLYSSIDMRLQYIAYRSLARAVQFHAAKSGSAVLMDAHTGEILAMVNQPSYNPNQRKNMKPSQLRNRALTDVFEPGSSIKPFTLAAAVDQGLYNRNSKINTSPGWFLVSGHPIKDVRNYGSLNLAGILRKSSNVGASRIALSLDSRQLWQSLSDYGFGEATGASFPAESSGYFPDYAQWQPLDHATMGFGYGLSVSITQLAKAYAVIANQGLAVDVSLIKKEAEAVGGNQISRHVMKLSTAKMILEMMEEVVTFNGASHEAAIAGYRVAGKTGTAKKSISGGYLKDDYVAVFAGMAPASSPRLVMAVMVDEPTQNGYYGSEVAAPVFKEVMTNALRILDIPPDDLPTLQAGVLGKGQGGMNVPETQSAYKLLAELLKDFCAGDVLPDIIIGRIASDSRTVGKDTLFIALQGMNSHGIDFAIDAVKAGAVAILFDIDDDYVQRRLPLLKKQIESNWIGIHKLDQANGEIVSRFYDEPARTLKIIGVTGTDGKTSVTHLLTQALNNLGRLTASIGTLGYGVNNQLETSAHTTPDAVTLHSYLHRFRQQSCEYVVMEVSSHALQQYRVNGCHFEIAVLTNLGRDHLDYHGEYEHYANAKAKLFRDFELSGRVINIDDEFGKNLSREFKHTRLIRYAASADRQAPADVQLVEAGISAAGQHIRVSTPLGEIQASIGLIGKFNIDNTLACISSLIVLGFAREDIQMAISHLTPIPGRMEKIASAANLATVVIDFAHTEQALRACLSASREHARAKLWCIFGCGGDRDQGKRKGMGRAAEQLADHVIITDDNPRTESPEKIAGEILSGVNQPENIHVVHNRRAAIEFAFTQASKDDLIVIAGKGHEQEQIIGLKRYPFSDRHVVQKIMQAHS